MTRQLSVIGGAMGGGGGGSSRAAIIAPDSLRSQAIVEIVEEWGWGEIEGFPEGADPLEYVFLDGVPVKSDGVANFEGVTFEYRLGTQDQSYIPGVIDDAVGSPAVVDVLVAHATPITRTVTDPSTDAVRVILTFAALMTLDTNSGDRHPATVDVQIEVRADGGSWTVIDLQGRGHIVDKTESAYQRSFLVDLRAVASSASSYDIRVTRLSDDPFPSDQSAFRWSTYVKLTYAKLRRPNVAHCRITFDTRYFSSIPVRSYLLRGWRIQVPTADVYDPIARTYTGADWSGTLVKSWSRNPAWFLYYLLTTAGIGLGDDINPAYQDKWQIYKIAKRCDELVPDGVGGTEPRYSIDAQFMAQTSAHDMIQQIAGIFDAQALWDGKSVYLTQDAPKPVTSLYLPANVVGGRFNYAGTARQVRYTAGLIQYNDPSDQYRLTTEYVEDFYSIERYGYRPKSETMVGCTSRSEAHRRGKRLLVSGREEIDAVTFAVGLSGINDNPGDIVRIADPLRSAGQRLGGRISTGSTASVIQLDAPVTLQPATSYRIAVIGSDGNIWDSAVVTAAGTHSAITVSPAYSGAPEAQLEWVVYDPLQVGKLYRILGIADNDDKFSGFYTISATQYAPDKFAEIDAVGDLGPLSPNPYIVPNGVLPSTGIQVTEGMVVGLEGMQRYLDISWEASIDTLLRGYGLSYRVNGGQVVAVEVNGQSYRILNPLMGQYEITLYAINIWDILSPSISTDYTLLKPYAIEDVSIINLGVKGVDNEFMGRNAELHWETDADTTLGIPVSYSGGIGGSTKWMRDFEVKIFTADGLTLLRVDYVTEHAYVYTFEKNVEDGGPRRTFKVEVRARDEFDTKSIVGTITPINQPPQSGATITTIPKEGHISFKIRPPSDPDYSYYRLFASRTSGFTPSDDPTTGNLIYSGSEHDLNFPINYAAAGDWYLRIQFVDEFGVSGTVYSGEGHQLVASAVADLPGVSGADVLSAITDFNASNNRNAAAVTAPTIAIDGTAIDHTLNANGSIDISIEWSWAGDEGDIDGFGVYAYSSTSSAPYTFTGTAADEVVFQLPASSRSYIHHGIPAFKNDLTGGQDPLYYTIGVVAYRKVDKDINADGVIGSGIVQSTATGENPYCPATAVAGTGDITATIDGILAANVNNWAFIGGTGRPFDNADVTKDQIAGSGVNILNSRYAVINESAIPPAVISGGTVALTSTGTNFNYPAIRITAASSLATVWMGAASTDYNFIVTPNKKWILSAWVRSSTSNAAGVLTVRLSDGSYKTVAFLTAVTPNTWTRVSGMIDASANASSLALMRLDNTAGSGVYIDFDAMMMEEMIGNVIAPSAFAFPAISTVAGMPLDVVVGHINDLNAGNNRNSAAIVNPVVASDNSALDYVQNGDGSADVSFEWSWSGDEGDIDGFAIIAYGTSTNHGTYTFGTNPAQEIVYQVPASRRAFIWNGIAANNYYTVAIWAYRSVDKDINGSGVIVSTLVYANGSSERPFRPTSTIAFTGDITGTVNGTAAATVVSNASTALSTANSASSTASSALSTANSAASTASSALSTANSAASTASSALSGLSTKLNSNAANVLSGSVSLETSGYAGGNGLVITSTGITAKKSGVSTFAIASNGEATFSGSITAGYGDFSNPKINPSVFGSYTVSCAGYGGNFGLFGNGNMGGVYGQSSGSGYGVTAEHTGGGVGLTVIGQMNISSSALVTNLNANYLQGYTPSSFLAAGGTAANSSLLGGYAASAFVLASGHATSISGTATGAATATFAGTNKPGSSSTNVWMLVSIDGNNFWIPAWPA
jgi:hypothetical protein